MANIQGGYGHSDVFAPGVFDYYAGAAALPTGVVINMQTSKLVLAPAGAINATINLPLNPPDGADAEITNYVGSPGTVTATVAANTGDALLGTAATALTAGTTFRYKYTLFGYQPGTAAAVNPRTWVRVL